MRVTQVPGIVEIKNVRPFDRSAVHSSRIWRAAGTHGTAVRSQADHRGVGAPNRPTLLETVGQTRARLHVTGASG